MLVLHFAAIITFCGITLGVTIDKKLKFDAHVAKICRRVSQQVAVLRRMKEMLLFKTRMKLYQSFIVPHFNGITGTSAARAQPLSWKNSMKEH